MSRSPVGPECAYCGKEYLFVKDGRVPTHDWPPPCRQTCPGSKMPPREPGAALEKDQKFDVSHSHVGGRLREMVAQWRQLAVGLQSEVAQGIYIHQSAESKMARVQVLNSCAGQLERLLVEPPTDGMETSPVDCEHLYAYLREDGWHCNHCGATGAFTSVSE